MLSEIIIREVAEGGAGGEAQVKTQFRNVFPGIGGTVRIQQPMMSAWREEFNQAPDIGKKIFLKHLILKKLDDFFAVRADTFFPTLPGRLVRAKKKILRLSLVRAGSWAGIGTNGFMAKMLFHGNIRREMEGAR